MPNPNIKQLEDLMKLVNQDHFSYKEGARLFEALIKSMRETREELKSELLKDKKEVKNQISDLLKTFQIKDEKTLADFNKAVDKRFKDLEKGTAARLNKLVMELEAVSDSIPEQADLGEVWAAINSKVIPTLEEITSEVEKKLPQYGKAFRDGLELLQDDERLDKSAIRGLDEEIERLEGKINTQATSKPMGMKKVPIIKRHRLTDQVDGLTRSFKLPKDTVSVLGLWGTQFPVTFDDNDWTVAGNVLTLTDEVGIPESGQTLIALVETLFY